MIGESHHAGMARKQFPNPPRRRTFFKEWREFRHLTQSQAAERLGIEQATLSRIERGVIKYTEDFLDAAAFAYLCEPADLLMRNPLDTDAVWSITDNLKKATPDERARAAAILDALLKKTG